MTEIPTKEDFVILENKVDRIEKIIDEISLFLVPQTVGIKEIATLVGMKPATLYNDNYRHYLPNFGHSDFPDGFKRWKRETVKEWEAIPINERKTMWERMGKEERRSIIAS